jgi:hypothetical protein
MRCIVAVWRAQQIADGAVTAGLLLHHGGALALARLLPRRRGAIPATLSELSPEWLSGALASRSPGVRVKSFEFLDRHSGTTSRARIALHYADRGSAPSMPDTLFVKITPAPLAQRLFIAVNGIGRNEVRFYRDARPDLPVRAPEVFAAQCGAGGRLFAILLEDLTAAGVRFTSLGDRASLDDARGVVVELAALHAAFWESPRFGGDLAWLPCYESRRRDMPWERFVTGQMLGLALRRFERDFPPELSRLGDLCIGRRDGLESLWARGARTLVHGDCHVGNLFFTERGVGFLDWQVCARAPGVRDVSYFLCNSFPSQLRAEHERDLIALYLDRLVERGVAAPSFEEAWTQHRLFAVYTWLAAAFTAAAGAGLQAPEIGMAGLRRTTRAATELESIALIDRLLIPEESAASAP